MTEVQERASRNPWKLWVAFAPALFCFAVWIGRVLETTTEFPHFYPCLSGWDAVRALWGILLGDGVLHSALLFLVLATVHKLHRDPRASAEDRRLKRLLRLLALSCLVLWAVDAGSVFIGIRAWESFESLRIAVYTILSSRILQTALLFVALWVLLDRHATILRSATDGLAPVGAAEQADEPDNAHDLQR